MTAERYIPFAFGLGITLLQPLIDRLWARRYQDRLKAQGGNITGVKWAAETSSFVACSVPVFLGIGILLLDEPTVGSTVALLCILGGGLLACLAVMFAVLAKDELSPWVVLRRKSRWNTFTVLQYSLILLNASGLFLARFLPHHG